MPKVIKGLTEAARGAAFTGGGYLPTGMIRWRVDQLHVGTPGVEVAREFWRRAAASPRPIKRAVVRYALRVHQQNRRLYRAVMRGF